MPKFKKTKSQLNFLKVYFSIFVAIILIPLALFGLKNFADFVKIRPPSKIQTVITQYKLQKVDSVFGIEANLPQGWLLIENSKLGTADGSNRNLNLQISDSKTSSNSMTINLLEFKKDDKPRIEGNPNGLEPINNFSKFQIFKDVVRPTVIIEELADQKIARVGQVIIDLNSKKDSPIDLTKPESKTSPQYNTRITLFPEYQAKYKNRVLLVEINYGEENQKLWSEYDKIIKSLKLTNF